jgi:hypothetical protein
MDLSVRSTQYQVEDHSWLGSAHGTTATDTITLDLTAFTANTHYPNGYIPSGIVLAKRTTDSLYQPYAGAAAEVQTATITGAPAGGTFTLTYAGQTTAAIAYNATAAAVQTALEGLSNVSPGDVTVTGSAGGPYTITFGGRLAGDQPAITATASLTGGTSPGVTMATTAAGGDPTYPAAGHLFASVPISVGSTATHLGAALFNHGKVVVARLPANHGLDQAARNRLTNIIYK